MNIDNQIKYWATLIRESYEDDVYESATDKQIRYANDIMKHVEPERFRQKRFEDGDSGQDVSRYIYKNIDKYNSDRFKNLKATDNQVLFANGIMQKLEPDRYKKDPFVIGVSKYNEVKRYIDKTKGKFNYGDKWEEHKKERKDEIKYGTLAQVQFANQILKDLDPSRFEKDPFVYGVSKRQDIQNYLKKNARQYKAKKLGRRFVWESENEQLKWHFSEIIDDVVKKEVEEYAKKHRDVRVHYKYELIDFILNNYEKIIDDAIGDDIETDEQLQQFVSRNMDSYREQFMEGNTDFDEEGRWDSDAEFERGREDYLDDY